ncbi:MAG: S-layer homology domain-containing protein [Evtepia gabavorous]
MKLNGNTTVYAKWTENAVTPTLPFTDVKSGDWFYEAVQYVYDKGMMTGVSADRFAPASTTTRGMIVTILYRLENEPAVSGGSAFTDVESGAWYADAVAWAAANDIVNGTSATTFAPNSPITREQMAAILYRYAAYKGYDVSQKADLSGYTDAASISGYAKDALAWANAQKLITGVTDTTLNPQGSATRAQVATILMRLCGDRGKIIYKLPETGEGAAALSSVFLWIGAESDGAFSIAVGTGGNGALPGGALFL